MPESANPCISIFLCPYPSRNLWCRHSATSPSTTPPTVPRNASNSKTNLPTLHPPFHPCCLNKRSPNYRKDTCQSNPNSRAATTQAYRPLQKVLTFPLPVFHK